LLSAKDVGVARAAARRPAVNRELYRQGRVELDVVGNLTQPCDVDLWVKEGNVLGDRTGQQGVFLRTTPLSGPGERC
jgi:hypothetical protein